MAVLPERLVREGLERGVLVEVRPANPVEVGVNVLLRKKRTPKVCHRTIPDILASGGLISLSIYIGRTFHPCPFIRGDVIFHQIV